MTLLGRMLSVAIPDTVLEEHSSLRDKSVKLGLIARSCAIFGVDVIQVFPDSRGRGEAGLIKKVLEYLETPQYLRKRLFQLDESLRFAGILPPLRIPSHKPKVPVEKLSAGELREGYLLADGESVDIGLDVNLRLKRRTQGRRVTVRVTGIAPLEGELAKKSDSQEYWGYSVELKTVNDILSDGRFPLRLATSRMGDDLGSVFDVLGEQVENAPGLTLIFGSPSRGLFELIGADLRERVDLTLNLFNRQNVVTVRTEEAVASALYLTELLLALGRRKFKGPWDFGGLPVV